MDYKYQYNKELTKFSRNNRKNQTDAEKLLWYHLRNKQLAGFKFRRQYPVQNYILDFYCLEENLPSNLTEVNISKINNMINKDLRHYKNMA